MQWKELFKPHILNRGWTYWRMGSVEALEADADSITATVEGSEAYAVRIELRGNKIATMTCTCPYAQGGENCKHMAAALYAWSEERPAEPDGDALTDCVVRADEAVVRKFLTEVLRRDPRLRERFERLLDPKRAGGALKVACSRVDEIVDRYMEDGFIDYRDAFPFMDEMSDALDEEADSLLQLRRPRDAFEFVAHVLRALDGVDMDDSDGERWTLMSDCQSYIEGILDGADEDDERYIFDRVLQLRGGDLSGDVFEELLQERFEGMEYQQQKLQRERRELARLAEERGEGNFAQMEMERRALCCLELMEKTDAARSEIEAFRREYWRLPSVRRHRMDELKRRRRWGELVEVLKESIALDEKTQPGLLPDYHLRLKDAYRKLGDGEAYRAELWALATRWKPDDLACFREYRALFPAGDWPAERERLLAARSRFADPGPIYVEEKLYDRLLELVLAKPGLAWLETYEKHLVGRYPDQVLQKYARELDLDAQNSAGRDAYRHWAATLRHMRSLPGGEETVRTLVAGWRERYPRRTAMLDELKGF